MSYLYVLRTKQKGILIGSLADCLKKKNQLKDESMGGLKIVPHSANSVSGLELPKPNYYYDVQLEEDGYWDTALCRVTQNELFFDFPNGSIIRPQDVYNYKFKC